MKAYKLELLIVDHDRLGGKAIVETLENQKYPNYCIAPRVMRIEERDVGLWTDDHPLNLLSTLKQEHDRLFNAAPPVEPLTDSQCWRYIFDAFGGEPRTPPAVDRHPELAKALRKAYLDGHKAGSGA